MEEEELVIYGTILSQPQRSVESYMKLSGLNFIHKELNIRENDHLSEAFTKLNPFQTFPLVVHKGIPIFESCAQVPYLADAYNLDNQWYPKDILTRAKINAFLHWHQQDVRGPLNNYVRGKLIGPRFYGYPPLTPEREALLTEKLNEFYQTFNWLLTEFRYAARTDVPTIADVFAFNEIVTAFVADVNIEPYPAIKRWFDEIEALPVVHEYHVQVMEIIEKIKASSD